jgi:hypothetical protein
MHAKGNQKYQMLQHRLIQNDTGIISYFRNDTGIISFFQNDTGIIPLHQSDTSIISGE